MLAVACNGDMGTRADAGRQARGRQELAVAWSRGTGVKVLRRGELRVFLQGEPDRAS